MKYTKQEWYTPGEVSVHNTPSDCWVALHGQVFNLTPWLQQQFLVCKCTKSCTCGTNNWLCLDDCVEKCPCFKRGYFYCDGKRLASTIIAFAGKDVSHWFKGEEWMSYTHPIVGSTASYYRFGPGPRQPVVPSTRWRPLSDQAWWLNDELVEGRATAKTRPIQILNTMTGSAVTLEVCSEETVYQIMMRYLPHNPHCMSYSWRYQGKAVCFHKTLEQNGIKDERELFNELGLPENMHIPCILIYYNDDLTEDPPEVCRCVALDCDGAPEQCYVKFDPKVPVFL